MKTSDVYSSGVLNKGEEIIECLKASQVISIIQGKEVNGFLLFTNKRFLFIKRPPGIFSKGFDVVHYSYWGDVVSVSTAGLIFKTLNITIGTENTAVTYKYSCGKVEDTANKILELKNYYVEETVIEARTVIIEEANKDKAMAILQKRLARGEITLEEFHKLVTRM